MNKCGGELLYLQQGFCGSRLHLQPTVSHSGNPSFYQFFNNQKTNEQNNSLYDNLRYGLAVWHG